MNILIVDDNLNNRLIVNLMIEDYIKANSLEGFLIKEASNGLDAVEMCKTDSFDIVFMDIMMPIMDGVEATRLIREQDNRIMIIAVSAVGDDNESKKQILNNGAEDYISKPINYDVFMSRMNNYVSLVHTRKNTKRNVGKINLFTDKVYKRHTKFIFSSEDALSEFWEFFLLNARAKYDNLSDLIRTIFSIADTMMGLSIHSSIYIEESDEIQYFTLTDIDKLPLKVIELLIKKNGLVCNYKVDEEKISFELEKKLSLQANSAHSDANLNKTSNETVEAAAPRTEEASSSVIRESSKELIVFDYIEQEDLMDLKEYSNKLSSLMLIVGNGGVTEDEIVDIYFYLDKLSGILSTYGEVYDVAQALLRLSIDMSSHVSEFMENSEALGPMCKAFSKDMSKWIDMSFYTGAPSVDFMNETIVVNCETITSMLKMHDAPAGDLESLDDIFDF